MPDLQQLLVVAFALVPGFIAAETQAFVAFRRSVASTEKVLLAVSYSAALYLLSTVGSWGPQYAAAFGKLSAGDLPSVLDQALLARYLLLLVVAVGIGLLSGRSLASGWLRAFVGRLTGRNVASSTWVEFFRDRASAGFWLQLKDGRRMAGTILAASDSMGEQTMVLNRPKWVLADGSLAPMNLNAVMVQGEDCLLIGEVLGADLTAVPRPTTD